MVNFNSYIYSIVFPKVQLWEIKNYNQYMHYGNPVVSCYSFFT